MFAKATTRTYEEEESTAERERGRSRIRRAHLTAIASIGFRGAMMVSSFVYIPATVHYLGPARYGLWVAMTSVITLLSFADCGLGFSLMNDIAHSIGRGSEGPVGKAISSTFFVLSAIAAGGCLLFTAAYFFIPWQAAFHARTALEATEAAHATAAIVIGFLLTIPFTTVQRVQAAHQEGYKTQSWEIGDVLLSLAALLGAIRIHAGLPVLAIAFSGGPLLAMVLNWIEYFGIRRPAEFPRVSLFDFRLARRIAGEGGYFLILQVAGIAVFSIDSFLILHYFGEEAFGKYSLVYKLFQVTPALVGVWTAALWPAYAEAIARGDRKWVRRTVVRSTVVGALGTGVVSLGIALLARPVVRVWTGTEVAPTPWLLAGLALFSVILVGTSAIAVYLSGSNYIKGQAIMAAVHASVSVVLKIVLCKYGDISGAIWGTNFAYLLVIIPTLCVVVPRLTGKLHEGAAELAGEAPEPEGKGIPERNLRALVQ